MTPPRRLGAAWTDLWLFDLRAGLDADAAGWLDQTAQERAAGFAAPVQAAEFLASRVALGRVLAHYGHDIGRGFAIGRFGKPELPDGPSFNLSRTRHAAIIAVSSDAVGVDLEYRRAVTLTEPNVVAATSSLRMSFAAAGLLPDPLQVWTAIEAWVKQQGQSMRWFLGDSAAPPALARELAAGALTLHPLKLPLGLCGSLCTTAGSQLAFIDTPAMPGLERWPSS